MSNRRFIVGALVFVLLAGIAGLTVELRWPHWTNAQQSAYQEFFTVFTGMLGFFFLVMGTYAAFQSAEASKRQAVAADRQAEAASAQVRAADRQTELLQETLSEQQLTRRLAEEPMLFVSYGMVLFPPMPFEVVNQGRGLALRAISWIETENTRDKFRTFVRQVKDREVEGHGNIPSGSSAKFELDITQHSPDEPLIVTQCFDRFGRWFQHHIIFRDDNYIQESFFKEPMEDYLERRKKPEFTWHE